MDFATDISSLNKSLQDFLIDHGSKLPERLRQLVVAAASSPSPVDRILKTGEALYAAAAQLDEAGKVMCAQLTQFAGQNGWHTTGDHDRAFGIMRAMQRDIGEEAPAGGWPDPESDPEILAEYAEPADPEPNPPGPAPLESAEEG